MRDKQSWAARLAPFFYIEFCVVLPCLGYVKVGAAESRNIQEFHFSAHGMLEEERGGLSPALCKAQVVEHTLAVLFQMVCAADTVLMGGIESVFRLCSAFDLEIVDELDRGFYSLRLTPEDCYNISVLITNIADLSLWTLLKKSKEMRQLGKKIEPVHPFRFLGWIFSNDELKERMPKIKKSFFKWKKFTEGLFGRLERESQMGNLALFIPDFAQLVGCSQVVIERKVTNSDWVGMLNELMR